MSFSEFLLAVAPEILANYVIDFKKGDSLSEVAGEKLISYLRQYYVVGGMPEAVSVWCNTHNIEDVEAVQASIINSYELDFVIQCGKEIVPIEVKSEKNVKARSLAEYRKKYAPSISVKTSMLNELSGNEVLNIPLYLISALKRLI